MTELQTAAALATPWLASYGKVPFHLTYPDCTLYGRIKRTAERYADQAAYDFMGKSTTYREMLRQIDRVARAFYALGMRDGDRVTICMPNCPQAVCAFYALNKIGALANMIHPLSSEGEILFYLQESNSVAALTLDQFYPKFAAIRQQAKLPKLVIASVKDALSPLMKLGYSLTEGRKIARVRATADTVLWEDFLRAGDAVQEEISAQHKAEDAAVILYSGGTSGKTKGILLSSLNFNALAEQTIAMDTNFQPGDKMLAVMPIFHGFGLGIGIHTFLAVGGRCILVPRFNAQTYARLLSKERPNYIAGVPTLYEALLRNPEMADIDLSCLKGVFSGGDSLSVELKKKFDRFLATHKATVQIREGYGTTECVTASCLTPYHMNREGSIGVPYPDTYYKICAVNSCDEVPYGEEGEICLTGPTVMLGYLNHPEETAQTLRRHADGHTWLHTGDLGMMDADGFIYFRQRIKRMIVSSGYNIYPSQLENVFDAHEKVLMSCVIGVPDALKIQKVKAFIQLRPDVPQTEETRAELMEHARRHIAKYALPYEIEFRDELPRTLVGKVAFKVLEAEEAEKCRQQAAAETADPAADPAAGLAGAAESAGTAI